MSNGEPPFGQKTRLYPFRYGYCQCGCNQRTQQTGSGIYPMYLPGHHPIDPTTLKSSGFGHRPSAPKNKEPLSLTPKGYITEHQELLDLYLDLNFKQQQLLLEVQVLRRNIEMTLKLIKDLWKGSEKGKQLVMEKLREALTSLESFK